MHEATGQMISLPMAASGQRITKKKLINLINAVHYSKQPLLITFFQPANDFCITAKALPGPTAGDTTELLWVKDHNFSLSLLSFDILKITVTVGHKSCVFVPESYQLTDQGIQLVLPDFAVDDGARQHQRFSCQSGLYATLTQNGVAFPGCLLDYSPHGIMIDLMPDSSWQTTWLSSNSPATMTVTKNNRNIYSGTVSVSKKRGSNRYIIQPENESYSRYAPKKNRTRRQSVAPLPEARFTHPITGKESTLKISNIGSLGFSVEEHLEKSTLIPGLIIPDLIIYIAGNEMFSALVQVIYRHQAEEKPESVRFGLIILSMSHNDHLKLSQLIQHTRNEKSYINKPINPDDLFDFFFQSGFIYPGKYAEIAAHKKEYERIYQILYKQNNEIFRHFVYQVPGQIHGHMSMLNLYSKTWLSQHHAALQKDRAGLHVLRALSDYINDSYQLETTNIRYILAYYRPTNKFPRRFFGEFAERTQDKTKVSLDNFAYFSNSEAFYTKDHLWDQWTLEPVSPLDIQQFTAFYMKHSGGLLPEALDLTVERYASSEMDNRYSEAGLCRTRRVFSLRHQGNLYALVDYQSSSRGLNLSELSNATTFFFLQCPDPTSGASVVRAVVSFFIDKLKKEHHPVMFYPEASASHLRFIPEKTYTLWILNLLTGSDSYMNWLCRYD
jgi:hypothetical protein